MATSNIRSNILNCPINIYAVSIDGFFKNGSTAVFSETVSTLSSYVKYMGYSHVLLLDEDMAGTSNLTKEKKHVLTNALHSNGIKALFCLTPRDVTDKKLYISTIIEQIKEQGFDGLYFNIPLPLYSDKSLLKQFNKEVHEKYPEFITILGNKLACEGKSCGFDLVLDCEPYTEACNYVSYDPYFRRHVQTEFEEKLFSSNSPTRLVSRSQFVPIQNSKSVISSSHGSYTDRLMQKRAIDLLLVTECGKKITLMGDEFSGTSFENARPTVDWNLLDTEELRSLRSFTRALNYFYLENSEVYASLDSKSLSFYSNVDKEKNVIAFKRSSKSESLITVVNLSGIEQSITVHESDFSECVFATEQYIGTNTVSPVIGEKDVYSITIPAFCGAVYRSK